MKPNWTRSQKVITVVWLLLAVWGIIAATNYVLLEPVVQLIELLISVAGWIAMVAS